MDRRQQRTREAIFDAFALLLSRKHYNHISVQEIIDTANVGRTTFYAHFETKEYLLKALCEELFDHILHTVAEHRTDCEYGTAEDSVFLHLLRHLRQNDRKILDLLSSENNEIFLRYFKDNLKKLIEFQYADERQDLPRDYRINHIAAAFAETVDWWIAQRCEQSPETIHTYFLTAVGLEG